MPKPVFRIKEIAKEKGLTIKEIASRIGIGLSALSQSIDGNPTTERLQQIADALEVPIADLFEKPLYGNIVCPACGATLWLDARTRRPEAIKTEAVEVEAEAEPAMA